MTILEILKGTTVDAVSYQPREEIFASGSPSERGTALVLEGSVDAFHTRSSELSRPVATYQPGNFFGLAAALSLPRMERAVAGASGAKVLYLNEADFLRYVRENQNFLSKLYSLMLGRLRDLSTANVEKPSQAIDVDALFGAGSKNRLEAIRRTNLKIPEYLNKMRNRFLSPGQKLFDAEDPKDSLVYLIIEGEIEQYWTAAGSESLVISIGPGSLFGFLRGHEGDGHLLMAKAGAKGAKLIGLDDDILNKICHVDAKLAYSVFQNVVLTIAVIQEFMMRDANY